MGRSITLIPDHSYDNKIVDFKVYHISEGQFKNDKWNGFVRQVRGIDTEYNIGHFKDGKMHGYGKRFLNGTSSEGFFENGTYLRNKEELRDYEPSHFVAQHILFSHYIIQLVP